jgi:uncharacterized protein (TIGR02466 family)
MSEILNFFPLTIYKSKIKINEKEKKSLVEEILMMEKKNFAPENKAQNKAWTGDVHGHEYLFNNEKFKNLSDQIEINIKKYLEIFSIDIKKIDIYFQRSWATISKNSENIAPHKHEQSHISFAYYLQKGKDDSQIVFLNQSPQSEFVPKLFSSSTAVIKKIIKEKNLNNSSNIMLGVEEGDIVIFPSKTLHGTQAKPNNDNRISISADIVVTVKDSTSMEWMMPSINNWKKFSD